MSKLYKCTCCASDVTIPYFHNGAAYGYTCIRKLFPSTKKVKDSGLWIDCTVAVHKHDTNGTYAFVATLSNGERIVEHSYVSNKSINIAPTSGLVRVAKYANGSCPIWEKLDVIQERDESGKLYPVAVKSKFGDIAL